MSHQPNPTGLRGAVLPLLGLCAAVGLLATGAAVAQNLPGVIIAPSPGPASGPPPGANPMLTPMMQPPQAPAAPQAPVAAPKPKPKPKVVAKPKEDAPAGDGEGIIKGPGSTRIGLLVNGEPITAYEIEQRARLMALGSDIQARAQANMKQLATSEAVNARWKQIVQDTVNANPGKSREQVIAIIQEKQKAYSMGLQKQAIESARSASIPAMRDKAKQELIEEHVKLQDARRSGAPPDESMVEDLVKDLAQRNKMSPVEFARHFAGMGVDVMTLKAKFRAQIAWTGAVRKQYGHLVQTNQRDLDKALVNFAGGEDQLELQLRRIVISLPPKMEQKGMAQKLAEAEKLQAQFKECRTVGALAAKVQGARYEDMGTRNASSFTEPSRSMLLNAQANSMIPPTMTSSGIELIAVCGRTVVKATEIERNKLIQQGRGEEFERLSRNHLRKLMDNAVIENR